MRIFWLLFVLILSIAAHSTDSKIHSDQLSKSKEMRIGAKNIQAEKKPQQFALHQNYPNPFNPQTLIKIETAEESFIELTVHDIRGQTVYTLVSSTQPSGVYFVLWSGTDENGSRLPSGIYYYRMRANDFVDVKRMLLLR